ncbi:MAG TPA: hypothetical protein VNN72_11625, partial [Polyangiaceae bacterium]|nr:hypothetical protein [Polyangiaceae bacterium]
GTGGTIIIIGGAGESGQGGIGGEGAAAGAGATGGTSGTGGTGGTGGTSLGGQAGEETGGAGAGGAGPTPPPNLYFSEYVEGSTTAIRALEIINTNGASVSLADCVVDIYASTSTTPTGTIALSGSLANGAVYVLCAGTIDGVTCNQTTAALNFTGNDAVDLKCDGTTLDAIGRIGINSIPWGNGTSTTTQNNTLRRLCSVTTGDAVGDDAFTPASQWAGLGVDIVDGLGSSVCAP